MSQTLWYSIPGGSPEEPRQTDPTTLVRFVTSEKQGHLSDPHLAVLAQGGADGRKAGRTCN